MNHYESPLVVTVKGGIAGLVGTAVLSVAMQQAPRAMERLHLSPPQPESNGNAEQPTATLAGKVAAGVMEAPIKEGTKQAAGQAIHWGYGAGWGAFYGIMQSSLRLPHLLHGTIFGGLVGMVASTLVPKLGLTPPPTRQPMSMNVMQLFFHLLYGWVTALTFHLMAKEG